MSETLLVCFPSGTQSFQVHTEGVLMPLFPFSPSSGAASWALGTTCHQTPLVSGQRQSGKLLWFFSLFPHWIVVMSHLRAGRSCSDLFWYRTFIWYVGKVKPREGQWLVEKHTVNMSVLVCVGCPNKILEAGWLKQPKFAYTFGVWEFHDQGPGIFDSWWGSLPACRTWLPSLCVLTWPLLSAWTWRGSGLPHVSIQYKGTNPIMRTSPSWPHLTQITCQRSHLQIPPYWELGLRP